ncbi:unnamed protein product [Fusarium langsethiae]|nr:unnamed protein product [Fusarium langsethiae]
MDSPPEAGSTRLTDADSVSEGAVEPIPVFAEKSRLMGTSRVTEEAGIDELRNSHLTLEESSPPWIFRVGKHGLLIVVPIIYVGQNLQIYALKTTDNDPVLLAIVASLHHKTQSAFGDNTLEALQLAATLWPISFAAVVGPFLKTLALFRAERGAALGSLEFLLTGQTTVAVFKNLIILKIVRLWAIGVAMLWCLSPVGGQAVVRSLGLRTNTQTTDVPAVHYFSQTPLMATAPYTGHLQGDHNALSGGTATQGMIQPFRSTVLAAFSASDIKLSHPDTSSSDFDAVVERIGGTLQAARLGQQDQWRNVRIPFMEHLPDYDKENPTAWTPVPSDEVVSYSSFIGVPIRGGSFPRGGNSSMILQSRYQILKCGEAFDGRSWLPPPEAQDRLANK